MTDPLSIPEVATALGSSQAAVRKAIARGTLRASTLPAQRGGVVTGWRYVVERDEVDRYVQEHRRPRK